MSFSDDSRPDPSAPELLRGDAVPLIDEDESGSGQDLQAENAALREQVMRYAAEAENTKRRAEREANDARAYAIQRFGRDLLGAADNLERALQATPKSDEPGVSNFVLGIEMTAKELQSAFDKNGLKKVEPGEGDKFDPNLHQAMMEEPAAGIPGGAVVRTLQSGYALYGRIVRPALVVTAARAAASEAAPSEAKDGAPAGAYASADGAGAGAAVDRRA